jgi:hypothetical protein
MPFCLAHGGDALLKVFRQQLLATRNQKQNKQTKKTKKKKLLLRNHDWQIDVLPKAFRR